MTEAEYYRQPDLWSRAPDPYQIQVLADLLDLLPTDAHSILDIGCGDGFLTNALPARHEVVALDASDTALRHVGRTRIQATATRLPLADGCFDLVMANDILEHLDDPALAATAAELVRVARHYILITVPLLEDLRAAEARCGHCGTVYHVNHHVRSWDEATLTRLFEPHFNAWEARFSGALLGPPPDACTPIRREIGLHHRWRHARCPKCGLGADADDPSSTHADDALFDHLRAGAWWGHDPTQARHVDRSELMVLFARRPRTSQPAGSTETRLLDLLTVEFGNPIQEVTDWTPGATLARWRAGAGCRVETGAIVRLGDADLGWFSACFPIVPATHDRIVLEGNVAERVRVFSWDPILGLETELVPDATGGFTLPRVFHASRFGAQVNVHLMPGARVERLRYVPAAQVPPVLFARVPAGHVVLELPPRHHRRTAGVASDREGWLPFPRWATEQAPGQLRPIGVQEVLQLAASIRDIATQEAQETVGRLGASLAAATAQTTYALDQLATIEKELATSRAEAKRLRRTLVSTRRVQRVLVLANWFPHDSQPGLGSFVLEQVQALREFGELDVRVVSGRPFWVNTLRPLVMRRGVRNWREAIGKVAWREQDGVPVLDVPYLVGAPFPVLTHSRTYTAALQRALPTVRAAFRFDLIHAHTAYLDGTAALRIGRQYEVPVVLTEHTGPFAQLMRRWPIRRRTLRTIRSADRCFAVSPALAAEIRAWLPTKERNRVGVLRNGIDMRAFRPPAQWSPDPSRPRIGSIGAFETVKNPSLLLGAFANLRKKVPAAELHMIGDGPLAAEVRARAVELGLRDAIRFLGRLPRHDVATFLRDVCDVLVVSSHAETFGVAAVEALASGKPVVATRCGGPESIITTPELGMLCANDDADALTDAMLAVVDRLREFRPDRIRADVAARYAADSLAIELASLYQGVAGRQTTRGS